jgi:hypothetical protein
LGVARLSGLNVDRHEAPTIEPDISAAPTLSLLSFIGLDGQLWGVPTAIVERIQDVSRSDFTLREEDAFVTLDNSLYPVVLEGAFPDTPEITVLKLHDGTDRIGYPVLQVEDLIRIEEAAILSPTKNPIALMGGEVIRLIDADRLFRVGDRQNIGVADVA